MMGEELKLDVGEDSPRITVTVHGNLHLAGWDRHEVAASASARDTLRLKRRDDQVELHCESNCVVSVPHNARVLVEAAQGNATVKGLKTPLVVQQVDGNLTLFDIGPAQVQVVHGNLTVEKAAGALNVHTVYGNFTARAVAGRISIDEPVRGNLALREVGSTTARARGNARVHIDPQPGSEYAIQASGHLHCRLAPGASAAVSLSSGDRRIVLDVTGEPQTLETGEHTFTLGEGEASLKLAASGHLHLSQAASEGETPDELKFEFSGDIEGLGEEITRQIELQMEALERQLNQRLGHLGDIAGGIGLSQGEIEDIVQQATEASQRAALRAQAKARRAAQRAQEKLARKLERARRKSKHRAWVAGIGVERWGPQAGGHWGPGQQEAPGDPVSDEERLMILQMLEQKKITVEEAEMLLEALEGRDG